MSRQVSRGSAGKYQADEQAGVARLTEDASVLSAQVQQLMDSFRLVTPDTLNIGS